MMATKEKLGQFDCYEKAEPDEPMFVLLARAWRVARVSRLAYLWALLRGRA